ncbi:MAG: TPM domain-containing protein [bacterium]
MVFSCYSRFLAVLFACFVSCQIVFAEKSIEQALDQKMTFTTDAVAPETEVKKEVTKDALQDIAQITGYPKSLNKYVSDFAKIIDPADAERIQKTFESVEEQTGIEIALVTINSIHDYKDTETNFERFTTGLFNNWGIGKKDKNNGVLFLVAQKDRKVRIELGSGYDKIYDERVTAIIKTDILPYFKRDQYSRGIYEGSIAIIKAVTKEATWWERNMWNVIIWLLIVICALVAYSCFKSGKKGWGWFLLAGIGALLLLLWSMNSSNKSDGHGGGSSSGGGGSGEW